jgi:HSP20 family protein
MMSMARVPFSRAGDPEGSYADDLYEHLLGMTVGPRYVLQQSWRPAVDVFELEDGLMLVAELPGVDEKDLNLTIEGERLRIAGVRKPPRIDRCRQAWQLEIDYGPFERLVVMPREVEAEHVTAHFRNGLLAVHVPWRQGGKAIRVPVSEQDET